MSYQLLIGNKNYSSWSLRPWLALRAFGIPFTEQQFYFDTPEFAAEIGSRKRSPNGRVPALVDGDFTVWDSLAIIDHLAEQRPDMWPQDRAARAHARSAMAEMHSGFGALRNWLPMCVRRRYALPLLRDDVQADVARITALWLEARSRFGAAGPYLYGAFSAADAYYAPVVFRFCTYGISLPPVAQAYVDAMLHHPDMLAWAVAAEAEPQVVPRDEPESLYEQLSP